MLKVMKMSNMRIVTNVSNMSSMVMTTTKTMILQFRVTSASGASLLDILGPWGGNGCPLLPDPTAYQVIRIDHSLCFL